MAETVQDILDELDAPANLLKLVRGIERVTNQVEKVRDNSPCTDENAQVREALRKAVINLLDAGRCVSHAAKIKGGAQ